MSRRLRFLGAAIALVSLGGTVGVAPPSAGRTPEPTPGPELPVVFTGRGNAHGMGLAMDGVLGQARAGWSYTKILDLFYSRTATDSASGAIRVGLAAAAEHGLDLPGGGTVEAGDGSIDVPPGTTVYVGYADGRYRIRAPGVVGTAQQEPPVPLPSPEPSPVPSTSPDADPRPTPRPSEGAGPSPQAGGAGEPVWVTPHGSPALTRLHATGRRYRGRMQLRHGEGGLWAINHVDLETYVQGIAEEKGAGWPVEGLKVLAVASRTLAVATRTWYSKHHAKGFDICPTGMCQVYLGYDGEEPSMTKATRETAGEIRTYDGRAILAMYHGNGGGQTDTYSLIYADGRSDPHPYLKSVSYPHASPLVWYRGFTADSATAALRARSIAVPGTFQGVEVLSTGETPRVRRVRVVGTDGSVETSGHAFRAALDLPSIWFDLAPPGETAPAASAPPEALEVQAGLGLPAPRARPQAASSIPARQPASDRLPAGAAATVALALALAVAVPGARRAS